MAPTLPIGQANPITVTHQQRSNMPRSNDVPAVGHNPMNPRHPISQHCRKGSAECREILASYRPIIIMPEDKPGRCFNIHCHSAIWLAT